MSSEVLFSEIVFSFPASVSFVTPRPQAPNYCYYADGPGFY